MSTSPQHQQAPSPEIIFDTLNGYQRTAALRGAIELDLFTAIAEGNTTSKNIAARIQASEKGTRVLCDFLTVVGFLTKEDGHYGLTHDSAVFLNRKSPAYMGSVATFLGTPALVDSFKDIAAIVRKGGTMMDGEGTVEPNNPLWVEFARSMAPMMAMPAQAIAELLDARSGASWKVLDIAAGHGLFGIAIAKQNPNARIVALDWEAVLAVAKENAEKAGVASRHSTIPGSAFDVDFGTGYNLALVTNFLHHFDAATNESLLKKVHARARSRRQTGHAGIHSQRRPRISAHPCDVQHDDAGRHVGRRRLHLLRTGSDASQCGIRAQRDAPAESVAAARSRILQVD